MLALARGGCVANAAEDPVLVQLHFRHHRQAATLAFIVRARVVLRGPPRAATPDTAREIQEFVKAVLAPYKAEFLSYIKSGG